MSVLFLLLAIQELKSNNMKENSSNEYTQCKVGWHTRNVCHFLNLSL